MASLSRHFWSSSAVRRRKRTRSCIENYSTTNVPNLMPPNPPFSSSSSLSLSPRSLSPPSVSPSPYLSSPLSLRSHSRSLSPSSSSSSSSFPSFNRRKNSFPSSLSSRKKRKFSLHTPPSSLLKGEERERRIQTPPSLQPSSPSSLSSPKTVLFSSSLLGEGGKKEEREMKKRGKRREIVNEKRILASIFSLLFFVALFCFQFSSSALK